MFSSIRAIALFLFEFVVLVCGLFGVLVIVGLLTIL